MSNFQQELAELLNKYSMEQSSDTPDFILANYLLRCFHNFSVVVNERERWYGRKTDPPIGEAHTKLTEEE